MVAFFGLLGVGGAMLIVSGAYKRRGRSGGGGADSPDVVDRAAIWSSLFDSSLELVATTIEWLSWSYNGWCVGGRRSMKMPSRSSSDSCVSIESRPTRPNMYPWPGPFFGRGYFSKRFNTAPFFQPPSNYDTLQYNTVRARQTLSTKTKNANTTHSFLYLFLLFFFLFCFFFWIKFSTADLLFVVYCCYFNYSTIDSLTEWFWIFKIFNILSFCHFALRAALVEIIWCASKQISHSLYLFSLHSHFMSSRQQSDSIVIRFILFFSTRFFLCFFFCAFFLLCCCYNCYRAESGHANIQQHKTNSKESIFFKKELCLMKST